MRQLTASELAQSWRATRLSATTDIASREVFQGGGVARPNRGQESNAADRYRYIFIELLVVKLDYCDFFSPISSRTKVSKKSW